MGKGRISGDGLSIVDVFLWLIPLIDDMAPLSHCVGSLVNYSLILLSVFFIWYLNYFSMSNMHVHSHTVYTKSTCGSEVRGEKVVSVSVGFETNLDVVVMFYLV